MPRRKKTRKSKKNNNSILAYLILVGFFVLMVFVVISQPNHAENYAFCEKLKELDNNYTELKDQLKKQCDEGKLSQTELELGNFSVEFMKSLSIFNASWKKDESIAKEYAEKTDRSYTGIKKLNVTSSEILTQVESLYRAEIENLLSELNNRDRDIKNLISSIKQLEEKNSSLTNSLKRTKAEGEGMKKEAKNLSLLYGQRKNESNNLESSLSSVKNEYEKVKNSFKDDLFPFLLIGIAIGGIVGFVLSLRWKKERSYWDAYSSSAKVMSPLKLDALLTGLLIIALLLYLFLSGKLELILAG